MINPCPNCRGWLTWVIGEDAVYLKAEYRCEACSRRYDGNFNELCGEIDKEKFLKKHGLINDFGMAFAGSKRYR